TSNHLPLQPQFLRQLSPRHPPPSSHLSTRLPALPPQLPPRLHQSLQPQPSRQLSPRHPSPSSHLSTHLPALSHLSTRRTATAPIQAPILSPYNPHTSHPAAMYHVQPPPSPFVHDNYAWDKATINPSVLNTASNPGSPFGAGETLVPVDLSDASSQFLSPRSPSDGTGGTLTEYSPQNPTLLGTLFELNFDPSQHWPQPEPATPPPLTTNLGAPASHPLGDTTLNNHQERSRPDARTPPPPPARWTPPPRRHVPILPRTPPAPPTPPTDLTRAARDLARAALAICTPGAVEADPLSTAAYQDGPIPPRPSPAKPIAHYRTEQRFKPRMLPLLPRGSTASASTVQHPEWEYTPEQLKWKATKWKNKFRKWLDRDQTPDGCRMTQPVNLKLLEKLFSNLEH
ncbi:hypothetical protein QBC39DRAFT_420653, partial [Podospora conica]